MGIPQIIYLVWAGINILNACVKHGQEKEIKFNLGRATLSVLVMFALFMWGGFFNAFRVQQIILCIMTALAYTVIIIKNGQRDRIKYNALAALIAEAIRFTLLITGGFFAA